MKPEQRVTRRARRSETKLLHYYLVESEGDPAADPVLFWFNGGPGCSSLDGFLYEHGPFRVQEAADGTTSLVQFNYSWSKLATTVYFLPRGASFDAFAAPPRLRREYSVEVSRCRDRDVDFRSRRRNLVETGARPRYVEAPCGVGFSYSTAANTTADYDANDDTAAQDNLAAVESLFVKFPQFAQNDMYITGESHVRRADIPLMNRGDAA